MSNQRRVVGNRPVVAGNESGLKLFRAYSIEENFQNDGRYKMHWFCQGREEPIGPYKQLIQGYERNNINQEQAVDECFTEIEIRMLRDYLKQSKYGKYWRNLKSIRRVLPIPGNILPYGRWCRKILKMNAQGEVFIENLNQRAIHSMLYTIKDYDLPFKVVGYCHPI